MKYEVKRREEMPLDPSDPFTDMLVAFKALREEEVLRIDAESTEPRRVGQCLAGVRRALKRADIENFQTRRDAESGVVWVWRKASATKSLTVAAAAANGVAAPLAPGRQRVSGAGSARGAADLW